MKKMIKTGFVLLILLGSISSFSQESAIPNSALQTARIQLEEDAETYNPTAALATYKQYANNGNAEAMNGLGLIYSKGIGTPVNEPLAVEWFAKSAQNNYPTAYYNLANLYKQGVGVKKDLVKALDYYQQAVTLGYDSAWFELGTMYKLGYGTAQDYKKALAIFKEGADKGIAKCLYAQGYMTYKGLATTQDYTAAVALFNQAGAKGSIQAMYMLGLCYRNGYGVDKDDQKALYMLNMSATWGYKPAQKELDVVQPENAEPNQLKTLSSAIVESDDAAIDPPKKLKKVKQKLTKKVITGTYTGTLLRYDYSGQNVISSTPIEVNFDQKGKVLTGIWKEQQGDSIAFKATIEKKMIVFSDSKIDRMEHYSDNELKKYEFRDAQLQVVENDKDVYIVGNLQLYDTKEREPEKPMYLILERKNDDAVVLDAETIVTKLVVYPNPVSAQQFTLNFDLAQQTPIHLKVFTMMGLLKYEQDLTTTGTGQQQQTIDFAGPPGNYLLNLYYGNHVLKTILIKK